MQTIRNKSRGPVRVGLPGGKVLFLGPGKTGEIGDNALEHPGVQKLVEAGEIEVLGHRSSSEPGPGDRRTPGPGGNQGHRTSTGTHPSGDR